MIYFSSQNMTAVATARTDLVKSTKEKSTRLLITAFETVALEVPI